MVLRISLNEESWINRIPTKEVEPFVWMTCFNLWSCITFEGELRFSENSRRKLFFVRLNIFQGCSHVLEFQKSEFWICLQFSFSFFGYFLGLQILIKCMLRSNSVRKHIAQLKIPLQDLLICLVEDLYTPNNRQ